ncbi:MAG: YiiD C-terminal domain-containing protein [Bacteriovoracaceae bacterium]|nr:YiiD C-terminal domain-containing protein [Bacteriovoracaceae bacterium]
MSFSEFRNKHIFKIINFYPPYLGAGVKVRPLNPEQTILEVSMKLGKLNQNYVGTHFGGSLYSMCDPWFMLILLKLLGKKYLVWDKSASIDFLSPGKGKVSARFEITPERLSEIIEKVDELGKYEPEFSVDVLGSDGAIVARVQKKLWIRKKP